MASLEGFGTPGAIVAGQRQVRRMPCLPRASAPRAGWRSGSSLSRGQLPVECCGSRRHCSPRLPRGASPCRPPRLGRLTGPVMRDVGRRLGHCPTMFRVASSTETASVRAVDCDGEGQADLPHARVGQPSEPLDEDRERDALDRVHVDHAAAGYRVLAGLEADFADEAADRGRAWCDECAPVSGDHGVAGEDDDRAGRRPPSAISHHQT